MKIISWNVNGIRSAIRNGFSEWLNKDDADIICLQEIKIDKDNLSKIFGNAGKYHLFSNHADKKGYSGVAVLTKRKPLSVKYTLGIPRFDSEGRMVGLEYPEFSLLTLYLPHGGRKKENLEYKLEVYRRLLKYVSSMKKPVILAGDFNIAHKDVDLARPKGNRKNIMFTPEERAEIDALISSGFIDSFRKFNDENGNYTWWPYMNSLREKNVGWRIDYIFCPQALDVFLEKAFILKDVKGSDHCPVGAEFKITSK